MNPTDTARALVEAYEAKVVQLTKAQKKNLKRAQKRAASKTGPAPA